MFSIMDIEVVQVTFSCHGFNTCCRHAMTIIAGRPAMDATTYPTDCKVYLKPQILIAATVTVFVSNLGLFMQSLGPKLSLPESLYPRNYQLPLEVFERVIDAATSLKVPENTAIENARIRRETLLACALTCRAWLFRSRYHLHQDVKIFDKKQLQNFAAVLRDSPDIGQFVRTLSTASRPQERKVEEFVHLIPHYFAGPLKDLRTLIVNNCDWRNTHPSFMVDVARFTTVTKLVLQAVKIGTSRELTKLVFAFPSLTDLTIREVQCTKNRPCQLFKKSRRCLPLEILLFRRGLIGFPLLRLLHDTGSNAQIHSLDIELNPEAPEIDTVSEFMQGCTSIRYIFLQIPLGIDKVDPEVYKPVSLQYAVHLRRFKFSSILSPTVFALLLHVLRTVSPSSITDMFIKFWGGWTPRLDDKLKALEEIDWASLDTVLSMSRFKTLANVCIEVDYLLGLNALQDFLEEHLPKLHKRGLLVNELDIEG